MALSDSLYLGVTVVLFVISLLGIALLYPTSPADTPAANVSEPYRTDLSGERYTVPADELWTLCLGTDCVPPIDRPDYVSADRADWLADGDQVIGVVRGDQAYAFPIRVLRFHGVVNANLAGLPVAVTYSPYSGVPRVFSRYAEARVLTFRHAGSLYNGNMVMRDRETGTRWSQFTGAAIRGEFVPAELDALPSNVVRWSLWRRSHPNTSVLSRGTLTFNASAYRDDPFTAYHRSRETPETGWDDALHPKEEVFGVARGADASAYRAVHVRDLGLVQDTVGATPVMLVQDEERGTIDGFRRTVNDTTLDFQLVNGALRDTATGSAWTMEGVAVEGPLAGTALTPVTLTRSYWYTWSLFHPDTRIYRP